MAKVIAVANTKGGSGKTTLATNIAAVAAVAGLRGLLVDADPQNSSIDWRGIRPKDNIAALSITTPTIHKDLPAISAGYDLVTIDCGGRDSRLLRSAVVSAGLVVIPCLASQVDLFAAADVVEIVKYAKDFNPDIKAVWVLNQIVSNTKLSQEIRDALAEYADDVTLCSSHLIARNAYRLAYGAGLGVVELSGKDKDAKATGEITALYDELAKIMGGM